MLRKVCALLPSGISRGVNGVVLGVALALLVSSVADAGIDDLFRVLFKTGKVAVRTATRQDVDDRDTRSTPQTPQENMPRSPAVESDGGGNVLLFLGGLCLASAVYLASRDPDLRRWIAGGRR